MANQLVPKNSTLIIERFLYRIVYAKYGRARYISHLDFMRSMQRIIKRSKLPVWYTQGFNPHVYIMFPMALSLGTDSHVEIMDLALTEELSFEQIKEQLGSKCPEGIDIISVSTPVHKHTEINKAEYQISFKADKPAQEVKKLFEEFISQDKIEIEKRTKKKTINLVDIKPFVHAQDISVDNEDVSLTMVLPAGGTFNLNANVVMDTFFSKYNLDITKNCILRTKIMLQSGESFT